jgi:hypothetical protein
VLPLRGRGGRTHGRQLRHVVVVIIIRAGRRECRGRLLQRRARSGEASLRRARRRLPSLRRRRQHSGREMTMRLVLRLMQPPRGW